VQGAKLGGGLTGRGGGGTGSADGEQEGDEGGSKHFPGESIVEEGEPPESPPARVVSELAPPAPAPAPKPPKPAKKPAEEPKKPAPKPKPTPAKPAQPAVPQIKLHVEPSDGGVTEAKVISVPAANADVPSLIKAVGVALGANVTEVQIWDDDFAEFAVLEDIAELKGGARVEVAIS
jgi:hypothetical protein